MRKITPETEQRLMQVIEKTSSLVAAGDAPNDAIIKAAEECGMRPGEIPLVVHAYNTGRTSQQRQLNDDPLEKAADFELADTSVILERMYPTQTKTAAAKVAETVVSADYDVPPHQILRYREEAARQKAAAAYDWRIMDGKPIEAAPPLPQDEPARMKRAMATLDRLRTETEEVRRKVASAFDTLGHHFNELTDYFRRPDAKPLPVVKEAVILMHGGLGEKVMDELVRVTPGIAKLANHWPGTQNQRVFSVTVEDLDCTAEPFDKVATIINALHTCHTQLEEYETAQDDFEKAAEETVRPFAHPAVSPSILGISSDERDKKAFGPDPLKALGTYSLVKNTMGDAAAKLKPPEVDKQVNSVLESLNDPNHENQLRQINAQTMLADLMATDPVISGYDPAEVASAYNDIVQVSPSVADQRMLVQNLMRKQLQQGALDTFEQDQLLGFEDKLRKQQVPLGGGKGGDGSVI